MVEIGDNFFSDQNDKNPKAIAFAFLRFSDGKKICSKVRGVVQGDSNVPPDQLRRHSSTEKKEKRGKNRMGFEPAKRLDSLDGIGTGGEGLYH